MWQLAKVKRMLACNRCHHFMLIWSTLERLCCIMGELLGLAGGQQPHHLLKPICKPYEAAMAFLYLTPAVLAVFSNLGLPVETVDFSLEEITIEAVCLLDATCWTFLLPTCSTWRLPVHAYP